MHGASLSNASQSFPKEQKNRRLAGTGRYKASVYKFIQEQQFMMLATLHLTSKISGFFLDKIRKYLWSNCLTNTIERV